MDALMNGTADVLFDDSLQSGQPSLYRTSIACTNCAATKTKCDRQYPCGRCRMKRLSCVSRQRQRRRGKVPSQRGSLDGSMEVHFDAVGSHGPVILSQEFADGHLEGNATALGRILSPDQRDPNAPSPITIRSPADHRPAAQSAEDPDLLNPRATFNQSPSLFLDGWEPNMFVAGWSPLQFAQIFTNLSPVTPGGLGQPTNNADGPIGNPATPNQPHLSPSRLEPDEIPSDLVRDWEHWSVCRCTPRPQQPATDRAKSSIVSLDENFAFRGPWSSITGHWRVENFAPEEFFTNATLSDTSREWLLMIAQRLLRVAMDIHGLSLDSASAASPDSEDTTSLRGYMRLPPSSVLHNYLDIVLRNYEPFYPVIPARMLNPNQLADPRRGRGSSLLLFLMFAFGSMLDPSVKAQRLSTALIEICRHSMHDVLEKDSGVPGGGLLFYSALIFTLKSAFSGDKAHMNIATAHRLIYITSIRAAGLFKKQNIPNGPLPAENESLKGAWQLWVERESVSRLAYGWVMLENEISLFYDCPPILTVSEMEASLPADESIWLASSAEEWGQVLCKSAAVDDWRAALHQRPNTSLLSLFQGLMDHQLEQPPQLLHMRLLLYPLHVMVFQLGQIMDCGLTQVHSWRLSTPATQNSSIIQFSEIRSLLLTWYDTFENLAGQGARFSAMRIATLMLYHIINLNLFTSFSKMEQLARDGEETTAASKSEDIVRSPEDAIIHCGQVLRLFREMRDETRPVWCPAAVYRVTVTLWALSISKFLITPDKNGAEPNSNPNDDLVIDTVSMRDPKVLKYLRTGKARPVLTASNGNVTFDNPTRILALGIDMLSRYYPTTTFSAGVRWKLEEMTRACEESTTTLNPSHSLEDVH